MAMFPFILACLLLDGSSTSANAAAKLSPTASAVLAPQQPSSTEAQSTNPVIPLTDQPSLPSVNPPTDQLSPMPLIVKELPALDSPPVLPHRLARALSGDFIVQYYDQNISTQDLLLRLNMTGAPFDVANMCPSSSYSCESVCPLDGNEARERSREKPCYCDKQCLELGDCCYDYFLRCTAGQTPKPQHPKRTCVKTTSIASNYGYAMVGSCPSANSDKELEELCAAKSSMADLFKMLPVSDLDSHTVYKNVFCARCNRASNQTYWKFSASCEALEPSDLPRNRTLMLQFVINKCEWTFKEPRDNYQDLKLCFAVEKRCPSSALIQQEPLLPGLCSFYVFPVCDNVRAKNPHCELCQGHDISNYQCSCWQPPIAPPPTEFPGVGGIPSLDILFDFSSSSSHTVKVGDTKTVVNHKACADGFMFDPFAEKCVQIYEPKPAVSANETSVNINCDISGFVKMNISLVVLLPNGSIWIPLHKRTYSNGSYFINGSSVFVCMNLTRNYTETATVIVVVSKDTKINARQILTYIGCAISMISLILLLGIYITVSELRTLPGKNLMSLSCAMLSYHTAFLLTGQTNYPYLCTTVSVLLHYCLLVSFCWMSVMAFDVAKTFGGKGQAARSSSSGRSKAAFVKYSIFAWITPAVIVSTSVILDKTDAVYIGYGEKSCWISNGEALLVVLGVTVALILVFNCAALSFTLVSIWKVQKSTRRVADQSQQTSLPILYIKLSSAMGFTWLLGFIFPFVKVEFVTYLFVICNSLQGFFIFLAFVGNKRTLNKVKGSWKSRLTSGGLLSTSRNKTDHSKTRTTRV